MRDYQAREMVIFGRHKEVISELGPFYPLASSRRRSNEISPTPPSHVFITRHRSQRATHIRERRLCAVFFVIVYISDGLRR